MKTLNFGGSRFRPLEHALRRHLEPPLSLPVRERGLKLEILELKLFFILVAPRAGAWIETQHDLYTLISDSVAPRAGAWIETSTFSTISARATVAPRAGAWIETQNASPHVAVSTSRSPCGSVDCNTLYQR